jgi:prevent-host-death family protein
LKQVSITELRASLAQLEKLLEKESEIIVTQRGRAVARIVPVRGIAPPTELRAISRRMKVPSEVLVRQDRNAR